ncbi:aromatic acid exporter family protein [Aneurinibacillus aneurinilyticus]|uniref:aromatic acid exporter family protein n=1 Tax=Aneurinibacillus aneurinilyticus TaxID=1391 RepID=UPI0035245525
MKIGFRIAKTALAVVLSIYLAHFLRLDTYTFAGVIAILTLQATRKASLAAAGKLSLSAGITLFIGSGLFYLLDFRVYVIGLILLLAIPLLVKIGAERGIVLCSVVSLHLFATEEISLAVVQNEVLILFSGMVVSLLVNMAYMPSRKKRVQEIREKLTGECASLFTQLANHLENEGYIWDGREILSIDELIGQGKAEALLNAENAMTRDEMNDYQYFDEKEKQFETIKRMLALVSHVQKVVVQGEMLAVMLRKIAEKLGRGKHAELGGMRDEIRVLRREYEAMPLPTTRDEFEIRAALLQILNELESYLLAYQ